MKKEYIIPTMRVRISNFDLCKAYPWPESQMPGTGGYAWPQKIPQTNEAEVSEAEVQEVEDVTYGKLW